MKQLAVILAFLLSTITLFMCAKEDAEGSKEVISTIDDTNSETRDGSYAPIFYKESATSDNWVMVNSQTLRKQVIFNKTKIDSIFFTKTPQNPVDVQYVYHWFYKVKIKYKDGVVFEDLFMIPGNTPYVAYKPYGVDLIPATNNNKSITYTMTSQQFSYYDAYWGKIKNRKLYILTDYNGVVLGNDQFNGSGNTETRYILPHKH